MSGTPDDRLVTLLSRWLAGHATNEEMRGGVGATDPAELEPDQAEALVELQDGLRKGVRGGDLEMLVRETLEAVALGG